MTIAQSKKSRTMGGNEVAAPNLAWTGILSHSALASVSQQSPLNNHIRLCRLQGAFLTIARHRIRCAVGHTAPSFLMGSLSEALLNEKDLRTVSKRTRRGPEARRILTASHGGQTAVELPVKAVKPAKALCYHVGEGQRRSSMLVTSHREGWRARI